MDVHYGTYNEHPMRIPPKAPPVYKPTSPRLAAPSAYRPNQINGPSAQLKAANNFKLETRPAPPVYRPQQGQSGLQPKPSASFRVETRPAPPAYKAQEVTPVLQSKTLSGLRATLPNIRTGNNAQTQIPPAVYRPPMAAISSQHPNRLPDGKHAKSCAVLDTKTLTSTVPTRRISGAVQRCGLLELFSRCWNPRQNDEGSDQEIINESLDEIEVQPKGRFIQLMQGMSDIAHAGDEVLNSGITGCGLVLGFGSKGIAAYHWPGMAPGYLNTFAGLTREVGELTKIEIYTSPIPKKSESSYAKTAQAIYDSYDVNTVHYTYGDDEGGEDFRVKLRDDGIEPIWPKNIKIFWSSP